MIKRILYGILIVNLLLSAVCYSYVWYDSRNYPDEKIEKMFEPITSKYGIKIVYKVDEEDFLSPLVNPGIPTGPPRGSNMESIRHRVLARYPALLQKALIKYPKNVII